MHVQYVEMDYIIQTIVFLSFSSSSSSFSFRSTTNKMFVKFVSDGSVQKAGFSATFIKELDECELKDHGCEHNCINTLGGYQCSCHIGYELHSDKKTCESECDLKFQNIRSIY